MPEPLVVTPAEAGQKLLQFLIRRFDLPHGVLHRWIRTGQVRINGGRAKAFDRVEAEDEIRIPPFAPVMQPQKSPSSKTEKQDTSFSPPSPVRKNSGKATREKSGKETLPPVVAENDEIVIFLKPSGLPVHPGSGHTDSLTTRIEASYAGADFMPAPVHRLDRDTSGLILVAKTYRMVRKLSDALAAHDGSVIKEYLAWVAGNCPWNKPVRLADRLVKQTVDRTGRERMVIQTGQPEQDREQEASLTVCRVAERDGASLVFVRLHTGRTHQIRAQLSRRGFPLLGDIKYGGPHLSEGLQLHAARLILDGTVYEALPDWKGSRRVNSIPPSSLLDNPLPESALPHQARATLFHNRDQKAEKGRPRHHGGIQRPDTAVSRENRCRDRKRKG